MRVLIIGAAGFAGGYLTRELAGRGHEVWGGTRGGGRGHESRGGTRGGGRGHESRGGTRGGGRGEARPLDVADGGGADAPRPLPVVACDVTRAEQIDAALDEVRPDGIALLAGIAWPSAANRDPASAFLVHALGTANLLAAVARAKRSIRTVVVTSGEVYGTFDPADLPLDEETRLRPATIYAASKAAADLAALAFARSRGLDVVRVRPFNHTGPGQRPEFVCADFAGQLAEIAAGRRSPVIEVGNLAVRRDMSDVRDIVRGYAAALERGRAGEAYNLCSGRATAIGEILDTLCSIAGVRPEIRTAAERFRPGEVPVVWGSRGKAERELGWKPEIELRQTLEDVHASAVDANG